ncbi:MAG: MFS transporter, partial [Spirochaetota bacterium]
MNRTRIAWDTQLGVAVAGITTTSLGPALPFLILEHGLSLTVAGTVFAFFSGGRAASVLLSTVIAERFTRKALLLTGHASFAIGLVLFAVSPAFVLHLLAIGVAGLGFGFTDAISNAVVAEVFHDRRGFALNRMHAFFGIGSIIGPAFATLVLASGGHWRIIFAFAALVAVAVSVFTAFTDIPERG